MRTIRPGIVVAIVCASILATGSSAASVESIFLDLVHANLGDYQALNSFYRDLLQDVRQHRLIDTVQSPVNLSKIRSSNYDEEYLRQSCYETTSDLLTAHGYDRVDARLSPADVQSLLPAILYSIENPGCSRKPLPSATYSFFTVWILGLIIIFVIKLVHLLVFAFAGDQCLSVTSTKASENTVDQTDSHDTAAVSVRSSSANYRLWLGLGLNSFTCGLMLGTIIYHLIPHIYEVPNENFDYVYLLRATVLFFGVYLFFIVEKLLRLRFKIDETHQDEVTNDGAEHRRLSDASMMRMGQVHGTIRTNADDDFPHHHSSPPARIPLNPDSDDEEAELPVNSTPVDSLNSPLRQHRHSHTLSHRTRTLMFYHLINNFSNDLIYGCGLCMALTHDYLIGAVLSMMIFSEGFRRHSQTISTMGRRRGLLLLLISIVFLLLGYLLGGLLIEVNRRTDNQLSYIRKEYIYSFMYGALFYTALVTLIPELNNFGQHLQINLKQVNQTSKQRRLIKSLILLCQNLFLIIGVILALVLASIWRYYHRIHIYDYVCNRDSSREFCRRH